MAGRYSTRCCKQVAHPFPPVSCVQAAVRGAGGVGGPLVPGAGQGGPVLREQDAAAQRGPEEAGALGCGANGNSIGNRRMCRACGDS